MSTPRIVAITACTVAGKQRDFANVYGLDEQSRVWQWDVQTGSWRAARILESSSNRGARR